MKIRNGFVSNSSTSSFICNLCGEEYSGWDASPFDRDYECYVCPNEHIMCEEHIKEDLEPILEKGCEHEFNREAANFCPECGEEAWVESEEFTISSKQCPICQFQAYAESEMAGYLLKTRGVSREDVFVKVKAANKRRKKLYDAEYITDVCDRFGLTEDSLLVELREKFKDFEEYAKFLRGCDED